MILLLVACSHPDPIADAWRQEPEVQGCFAGYRAEHADRPTIPVDFLADRVQAHGDPALVACLVGSPTVHLVDGTPGATHDIPTDALWTPIGERPKFTGFQSLEASAMLDPGARACARYYAAAHPDAADQKVAVSIHLGPGEKTTVDLPSDLAPLRTCVSEAMDHVSRPTIKMELTVHDDQLVSQMFATPYGHELPATDTDAP